MAKVTKTIVNKEPRELGNGQFSCTRQQPFRSNHVGLFRLVFLVVDYVCVLLSSVSDPYTEGILAVYEARRIHSSVCCCWDDTGVLAIRKQELNNRI